MFNWVSLRFSDSVHYRHDATWWHADRSWKSYILTQRQEEFVWLAGVVWAYMKPASTVTHFLQQSLPYSNKATCTLSANPFELPRANYIQSTILTLNLSDTIPWDEILNCIIRRKQDQHHNSLLFVSGIFFPARKVTNAVSMVPLIYLGKGLWDWFGTCDDTVTLKRMETEKAREGVRGTEIANFWFLLIIEMQQKTHLLPFTLKTGTLSI